jgi:hypothetical protein
MYWLRGWAFPRPGLARASQTNIATTHTPLPAVGRLLQQAFKDPLLHSVRRDAISASHTWSLNGNVCARGNLSTFAVS